MLEQAHNERAPAPNVLEHQKFNFRPLTLTIKGELGVANLTAKEVEVLNLLVRGMSGKDIAQALNRSNRTIETHIASMRTKTGFKKSKLVTEALIRFKFAVIKWENQFKESYSRYNIINTTNIKFKTALNR